MTTALIATGATAAFASNTATSPFREQAETMEIHASDFIGMRVYTAESDLSGDAYEGAQDDWNDVGEINDVVLSRDGMVNAVLVDIGGFLGMGEKPVALELDKLDILREQDGADMRVYVSMTKEELEAMQTFEK
ncbi:PRC-barrel domain-containing protein [Pseudophaeobacter sp.]|uniref:PRC-barrel domain-containing protein n=1 Tax=Pseudophaeobacter sp. TaxID=1971739 RepID=UPI002621A4A7|nr:PRC-barrel domain-containing protein [Pseudophaeobacter sp.]